MKFDADSNQEPLQSRQLPGTNHTRNEALNHGFGFSSASLGSSLWKSQATLGAEGFLPTPGSMNPMNATHEGQLAQVSEYGVSQSMSGQYAYANSRYTSGNRAPGSSHDGGLGQHIETGEEIDVQGSNNTHIGSAGSKLSGSRQGYPISIDDLPSGNPSGSQATAGSHCAKSKKNESRAKAPLKKKRAPWVQEHIRKKYEDHIPYLVADKNYKFVGFPPDTLRQSIKKFLRSRRDRMPAIGHEEEYLKSKSSGFRAAFDAGVAEEEDRRLRNEAKCQKAAKKKADRKR
jgi:hypothetical protein